MALSRVPLRSLWHAEVAALTAARLAVQPDAVIVDLDGAHPARLPALVAAARRVARSVVLLRIGSLAAAGIAAALDAALPARPDGVLLCGCADGRDLQHCGVKLAVAEAEHGLPPGALGLIAAPSAAGFLRLGGFLGASERLRGFACEQPGSGKGAAAEDAAVLGTLLRLAARSAGVPAYGIAAEGSPGPVGRAGFDGWITRDVTAIAALAALFSADG